MENSAYHIIPGQEFWGKQIGVCPWLCRSLSTSVAGHLTLSSRHRKWPVTLVSEPPSQLSKSKQPAKGQRHLIYAQRTGGFFQERKNHFLRWWQFFQHWAEAREMGMTVSGWPGQQRPPSGHGHQFFLDLLQNVKRNVRVLELFWFAFCCYEETLWPKATWGRRGFIWFTLPGPSQSIIGGNQGKSVKLKSCLLLDCLLLDRASQAFLYNPASLSKGWCCPQWPV